MDYIKIFANDRQIIIKNLLRLTRELRKLHLNVQTAKTKVFDEHQKEISRSFFSLKMDLLNKLDTSIGNYNNLDKQKKSKYASELEKIIMGNDRKKFKTTKELSPLDFRAFLRYISMSCALQNKACINKFFSQIKLNMDLKLLNKLSGICRSFSSQHRLLERNILDLIRNYNLFYYQTAKCLESLRCLNSISDETLQYVWETLLNSQIHFYVRMQAAYLLISHPLSQAQQEDLYELFLDEKSSQVRHAVLFLLLKWKNDKAFINDLISLPDQYISKVGTFLSNLQKEYTYTKNSLSHFLKQGNINVFLPMLYVIANSNDKKIKRLLKQKLENVDCNKIFPICLRKEVKSLKTKLCPY